MKSRPISLIALSLLLVACGDTSPKTPSENNTNNNTTSENNTTPGEPLIHRTGPVACDNERPAGVDYPEPQGDCASDADCTDGENGRCLDDRGTSCTYDECFSDDDCPGGSVCECGGGFHSDSNACIAGNCVTDADCGDGFCSPSLGDCGNYSGYVGYFCHTDDDECLNDEDCAPDGYCAYDQGVGHWVCSTAQCVG